MALTISAHPAKQQTNAPSFTVDTSLTEGASYQSLRIRATVYVAGQNSGAPVAVMEQPDGLNDWDFADMLKSYIGRCNAAAGGSELMVTPEGGSELITSWANLYSGFSTFSSTANKINSATDGGAAESNNFTDPVQGDLLCLMLDSDYSNTHATESLKLQAINAGTSYHEFNQYSGKASDKAIASNMYYCLCTNSAAYLNAAITINTQTTGILTGTFLLRKITDLKGSPVAFFRVVFEEIYENASNVTTTGDEEETDTLMFVPAVLADDETFNDDFLFDSVGSQSLLSRALTKCNVKYKYGIGMELRLFMVYNEGLEINSVYDVTGEVAGSSVIGFGWAMLIINDNTVPVAAATERFTVGVEQADGIWDTGSNWVTCDLRNYFDARALSFVGQLGEETVLMRGKTEMEGQVIKEFYTNSNRIRVPKTAYKRYNMQLNGLYEHPCFNVLLHELLYTLLPVWMYDPDMVAKKREVSILTDAVTIFEGAELVENTIEVEYYE